MFARLKSNWLIPGCVALVLLTVLAAVLQYRWINRVTEADRRQRHDLVALTLRNFSADFRENIFRPATFFRLSPVRSKLAGPDTSVIAFEPELLEIARRWRSTADRPQLLGSISIALEEDKGILFKSLAPGDDQFKVETWPDELVPYRTVLEQRLRMPAGGPPFFARGFVFEFFRRRPILVLPLVTGEPPPDGQRLDGSSRQYPSPTNDGVAIESAPSLQPPGPRELFQSMRPAPGAATIRPPELHGWCFLELDPDYLREHLLPELVARYYGPEARADYHVSVVSSQPLDIIYRSEPALTIESLFQVDAGIVLLETNVQPGRPGPPFRSPGEGPPSVPPSERHLRMPPPPPPQPLMSGPGGIALTQLKPERGGREEEAWLLVVKNKAGSLESLVEHARLHNLAVSFAILLLLAGSIMMLMLATTRARSLVHQQMEFVAGVSHELRTPLTVIQSTSYNLSQGMIQDPSRVRQYGDVIQNESRRLINQVESMLSFAGIQSGRRIYDPQPTSALAAIERALAESANAFAAGGWQVVKEIEEELPLVLTDAVALESGLKNLLENALKYASQGKWLSVTARSVQTRGTRATRGSGTEVQITIADHGPGIGAKDLPHIFEPFFRGQAAIASAIGGAGLGLCLVERQMRALGGKVTVKSSPQSGTSFTLHLPVAEEM
jgi:signal transduction histidine kinase